MKRTLILIGCILAYWGCLVAVGLLYGLLAAAITFICACAVAAGAMLLMLD